MSEDPGEEPSAVRRVLLLSHTGRDAAREVTLSLGKALTAHGIVVRMMVEEADDLGLEPADYDPPVELVASEADAADGCELAVVIGGDGSILRAAELTWGIGTPVLGVNLGHVGFLAEAEVEEVEAVIDAIVACRWTPEDRLTLDVRAFDFFFFKQQTRRDFRVFARELRSHSAQENKFSLVVA